MTGNYTEKLCAIYDTTLGRIISVGIAPTLAGFTRDTIPVFNNKIPLNDLKVGELAEIETGTGKVIEKFKGWEDWKEVYKFTVGEAVENERETSKKEDKE